MKKALVLVFLALLESWSQSTYYKSKTKSFEYVAPQGWYIVDNLTFEGLTGGSLWVKNNSYPALSFALIMFGIQDQPTETAYHSLFGQMRALSSLSNESPSLRVMIDTALTGVKYIGAEFSTTTNGEMYYSASKGTNAYSVEIFTTAADHEKNRAEYYKNFSAISFTSTSTMPVLPKVSSHGQAEAKQALFDLLGRAQQKNNLPYKIILR